MILPTVEFWLDIWIVGVWMWLDRFGGSAVLGVAYLLCAFVIVYLAWLCLLFCYLIVLLFCFLCIGVFLCFYCDSLVLFCFSVVLWFWLWIFACWIWFFGLCVIVVGCRMILVSYGWVLLLLSGFGLMLCFGYFLSFDSVFCVDCVMFIIVLLNSFVDVMYI